MRDDRLGLSRSEWWVGLTDDEVDVCRTAALHSLTSMRQARELGLRDPHGSGSCTHPDLTRMLNADGKVVTPLFNTGPGDTRVDGETGEIVTRRAETDAHLHFQGDGPPGASSTRSSAQDPNTSPVA